MSDDALDEICRMYNVPRNEVWPPTGTWRKPANGADEIGQWMLARAYEWVICGIDLDRHHVGAVVQRVIKTDNSKVRRIP